MAEYMLTINAGAGETVSFPCPAAILGVYSVAGPIDISWNFNGNVGQLVAAVDVWEPVQAFRPGKTSALEITTTAAGTITIRCEA